MKELGFGSAGAAGGGGREMEESEPEEGEAGLGKEEDDCIDPDVDLSYIDTKLQDVLGHLQREFEGGVSLENLGAKFGGYGSFLPTCKRSSSILSQPGSPPKEPGRTVIKSPHGLSCEGPCNDSSIRINAPITKTSPTLTKELDLEGSARKDTSTTATPRNHIEDADLINKGTKGSIQNTLKVCIKVGSDNISDRNNAAIYSGLGLELSPSLSVEDSPEGMKGIHEDGITNVSPRAILQMMTGFPISEGYFLSPLQENLLCLTKAGDRLSGSKSIPEAISILGQLNSPLQSPENCRETAMKLLKENIQIGGNKSKINDDKVLEKKVNVETPEGQNLSVQASGIPLLLNSGTAESKIMARKTVSKIQEDVVKGIKNTFDQQTESRRMLVKDSTFNSSLSNRNSFESKRNMESDGIVGLKEKAISIKAKPSARLNLTSEDSVEKNKIFRRNALSCKQKECMDKPENDINSNEVEVDGPKVYKNHISGTNEFIKLNNVKKTDNIPEIQGKLKANASYATSVADPPQKPMVSLSSGKEEKKFHARGSVENKSEELKSHKESLHDYPKQSQREVAWEKKGEVVAGRTQHMVTPLIAKNSIRDIKITKKRPRVKSVDNNSAPSLNFEAPIQTCTDALVYDDSATDAAAASDSIVIKDSWACCDLCEKWRLLPNGTNPDDLPRKWTCSMQLWLPVGMNHCIVSEDETTNFMNSQCHTSLVENSSIPEYSAPLTSSATVHVDQVNCQIGSIVDRNCSQVRTTSDASMKMQKEKLKVKGKSLKRSSNGVGIVKSKDSKLISKGLINSNISGAKKMIDPDGSHLLNKDAKLGPNFTAKVAPYSANGSSVADLTGKHMREIGDKFLSNSMRDLKGSRSSLNGSVKAHLHTGQKIKQVKVRNARTTDNSVIPGKKRKEREWHDIHNNQKTAMRSQHLGDKRVMHGEDASRSVEKKENKSNACNSVAEQYSMGKMTGAVDKSLKTRLTSRTGKLFIDGMENNKVASVQPSAQGNSSSLRLSSPCLNNANFQESRGSPLDSVFLSPLGAYSSEKHSQIRNSVGKSDTKYLGSSAIERSNRCLDGQVNGKMSPLDGPCNDHAKVSLILDGGKTESGIPSEAIAPDHQDKHLIEPFDVKLLQNQDKLNEAAGIDEDIANSHFGDRTVISESGVCFRDRNKTSESEFNKGNMKLSNVLSEQEELHSLRNGEQGALNQGPHFMSSVKTKGSEEFPTCDTVSGLLELASDNKDIARHGNLRREKVHELTGCPMRKGATSNAALVAMKDAKELKHAADRMKNLGQEHEGTALYFQAALKFLQAAFLSEPSSVINIKYDELNESMKTYTQTAALCEFCAREYEKRKDMAFAALAYKCVEVAYFRVAFLKNHAASKDHHELQATMQAFSQDDSPSSSASDIDNQPGAFEKATYSKAVCSLQDTGSHVLTSRSGFTRWLDYTNVSISAFEASRKSQYALSVASASLEKNGCDSIASVEEALNFSFHNVEELLRRIRAAMESFNH